jgi:Dynamitin
MATTNIDTSSTPVPKHDADQAGGEKEVVYSSDGADPVKVYFPPKVNAQQQQRLNVDEVITTSTDHDAVIAEGISPELAFEMFSGKMFPIPRKGSSTTNKAVVSTTTSSGATESPIQRLSRLQQELNELQEYVTSTTSSGATATATTTSSSSVDDNTKVAFESQIAILRDQWSLLSEAQVQQKERLNATIDASIVGLQATSSSSSSVPAEDGNNNKIKSTAGTTTVSPSVEDRMKRLELAVGASGSNSSVGVVGNSGCVSVLDRLNKLENLHNKLDDKQSEQLQKRAKVIRQDLEAAAKARNKLMTAGGANGIGAAEDSKTISALYDQLQSLSGMSEHLPVLTQRLQLLAQQHSSAATWDTRLRAVESITMKLEHHVTSVEQAIQNLNISVQENVKQMQQNMNALDERMNQIGK